MPTYEYECCACGHRFELFQQISDAPKRKCPKCSKLRVRRLIGAGSGILFKGSGFYCTDYRPKESGWSGKDKKPVETKSESAAPPPGGKGKESGGQGKKAAEKK